MFEEKDSFPCELWEIAMMVDSMNVAMKSAKWMKGKSSE